MRIQYKVILIVGTPLIILPADGHFFSTLFAHTKFAFGLNNKLHMCGEAALAILQAGICCRVMEFIQTALWF